jgi:hypothetical protein
MRFALLTILCLHVVVPLANSATQQAMTKNQAITIADRLITTNGCSDLLPVKERSRPFQDWKMVMKHELICKAYAVHEGRTSGRSGWTIIFKLAHVCPECPTDNILRAVTMDQNGRNVHLERMPFHSDQLRR